MANPPVLSALIVDDNFYNRDLCKLALEHVSFDVTEAENGAEALTLLGQGPFHLMILDLAMPEMSGVELLQTISQRYEAMSIIVMTANPHMVIDEVTQKADLVIYKPIDINQFVTLVTRLRQRMGEPSSNALH